MVGIVGIEEALKRARQAELDLVEVSADADPPVCRILDYGKYRYEQSKKDKANKARSKAAEMKEVRLGRSMKIDPHDVRIRLDQARRFLMDGHKVQIVQNFRGRELMHRHRGHERMDGIIQELADISRVEMSPRLAGRRMTMILGPEKAKIEQIKRRQAAEEQEKKEEGTSPEAASLRGAGEGGSASGGAEASEKANPADGAKTGKGEGAGTGEGSVPEPMEARKG